MVIKGLIFEPSKALATTTGLTQSAAIGLPIFTRLTRSSLTSGRISPSGPEKAQVVKFFAEPNPPGMTSASISAGATSEISLIFPRAIRADSMSIFLLSFISSPLRWLMTWCWFLFTLIQTASEPISSIASNVKTAS